MKLVIGGHAQGKCHYVLQKYGQEQCEVWEGLPPVEGTGQSGAVSGEENRKQICSAEETGQRTVIWNRFHEWVKNCLVQGGCPEEEYRTYLEKYPDCIVISDEIGNGIVPIDSAERDYRERTGRILVELAGKAEEVERVICGIGQKIK